MKHRGMVERMMQALDGALDPAAQSSLEEHLIHCADCQMEWEQLQAVEQLFGSAPMARPQTGFTERVLAHLDPRRRIRRTVLGGLALAGGWVAALVLALIPAPWAASYLAASFPPFSNALNLLTMRLADAAGVLLKSVALTIEALARPLVPVAVCGLILAFSANLLWLSLIRRLQPLSTTQTMRRR